jgi:pSer/pThr/pTyr-binding forkhead associated (FHA) protein
LIEFYPPHPIFKYTELLLLSAMPATSSINNPRFTTDSNNNSGGNVGGGARTGIGGGGGGGGGGGSTAAARTNDTGRDSPTTPTFLERHGHTPMNLDVQVLASQNGTRRRAESSPAPPSTSSIPATTTAPASAAATGPATAAADGKISIRIVPAMDSFTRLPLRFDPIDRKVDNGEVLVVGRHTDRLVSEHPNAVVFRSKVVSRNHAKMWSSNGQWYLQDVGSSSGTFLNHIRLSPPNVESTPYTIKDGDIVQLGIDFRVSSPGLTPSNDNTGRYRGSVQMRQNEN